MPETLHALASEVLRRLAGARLPEADKPQILAGDGDAALLRTATGLEVVAWDRLPASVDLAHLLDHTLLKPAATESDIRQLCREAEAYRFASVCVNPRWVALCSSLLGDDPVGVCAVVGFPLGASTLESKVRETEEALANGASEIDFVLSLGLAKAGDWIGAAQEFRALRRAAGRSCLKVILETCLLEDREKRQACALAREEQLDFVKTSTGFSTGGATPADVALMRAAVGTACGVKASGGIRDRGAALGMIRAGATRLGVSASLALL